MPLIGRCYGFEERQEGTYIYNICRQPRRGISLNRDDRGGTFNDRGGIMQCKVLFEPFEVCQNGIVNICDGIWAVVL